jgi:SWI/SNF related-matrix-associated actin-dependent regulator of chromatin subfamily C
MENPTYSSRLDREAPWSDAEVLRLLEGLERFDEDWNEIADHVGTRTREECAQYFLQMDIEGKYLDSELSVNAPTGLSMLGSRQGHLPFSNVDNPVMSVVSYLSSLADPVSAAAAAGKSADELKKRLRSAVDGSSEAAVTNGKGKEKAGGETMDIDLRQEVTTTTTTTTTTRTAASMMSSIPLAAIGARSSVFASHEEREMTRLVAAAANITLEKLELKLKYFNDMEAILQAERRELERGRQQLYLERLAFKRRVKDTQEGLKASVAVGGEQGLRAAHEALSDGERLTFQAGLSHSSVQPLSAEGQIKSYEA